MGEYTYGFYQREHARIAKILLKSFMRDECAFGYYRLFKMQFNNERDVLYKPGTIEITDKYEKVFDIFTVITRNNGIRMSWELIKR